MYIRGGWHPRGWTSWGVVEPSGKEDFVQEWALCIAQCAIPGAANQILGSCDRTLGKTSKTSSTAKYDAVLFLMSTTLQPYKRYIMQEDKVTCVKGKEFEQLCL